MKLYTIVHSPYVRKVRMLIRETGLLEQVEEIATTTSAFEPDPAIAAISPTIRVPVLLRDSGKPLGDSRVITRYLDDIAGGGFYPAARLWDVLAQEAAIEGVMDSAFLMALELRQRPEERRWPAQLDAHWAKIENALDGFERDWEALSSHSFDITMIAMACALSYLDFRHDARGWRQGRPRLAAWFAEAQKRPSFIATQD